MHALSGAAGSLEATAGAAPSARAVVMAARETARRQVISGSDRLIVDIGAMDTGRDVPALTAASDAELRDAGLVARCREGDTLAAQELLSIYRPAVLRLCSTTLCDADLAEEATQETMLQVWARLPTFEGGELFSHYVMRVARFRCLDIIRRREADRSRQAPLDVAGPLPVESHEDRVVVADTVDSILNGLGGTSSRLLALRHIDGLPPRAIAQRIGSTPGSVSVRLTRAKAAGRHFAMQNGLLGIAPLGLFVAWLRRLRAERADLAHASGAVLVAGALVVTAGVPEVSADAASEGVREVVVVDRPSSAAGDVSETRPGAAELGAQRLAPSGGADQGEPVTPEAPGTNGPAALAPIPEATVPVTGDRIHQDAPDSHDMTLSLGVDGQEVVAVGVEDDEESAPAHYHACDAVRAAPFGACSEDR